MRVYIAGPYTIGNEADNVREAIDVANTLRDLGHAPFVPHLSHFWHLVHARDYEDWVGWCLEWVPTCDAMLRLPGTSAGADREVAKAQQVGIPVYHSVEQLVEEHPE